MSQERPDSGSTRIILCLAACSVRSVRRSQVVRFFDGMTPDGPGVVPATGWYGPDDGVDTLPAYFGVGVKQDSA